MRVKDDLHTKGASGLVLWPGGASGLVLWPGVRGEEMKHIDYHLLRKYVMGSAKRCLKGQYREWKSGTKSKQERKAAPDVFFSINNCHINKE